MRRSSRGSRVAATSAAGSSRPRAHWAPRMGLPPMATATPRAGRHHPTPATTSRATDRSRSRNSRPSPAIKEVLGITVRLDPQNFLDPNNFLDPRRRGGWELSAVAAVSERDRATQVVHARVTGAERSQPEPVLDRREDRRRVVDRVVDAGAGHARAHEQGGDPGAGTEPVVDPSRAAALAGGRDVVPLPAELVVGDDDEGVL